MELAKTSIQEWIAKRASAVRDAYTSFSCLMEHGIDTVPDESTPTQLSCPFHGIDARPSARYYPATGGRSDYVRCFKCKENWDAINLHAKFKGLKFMDALQDLERRFRIRIPQKPEAPEIVEPIERKSDYVSDKWADVPRVLALLEKKLQRLRERSSLIDYVKFCRVIDAVQWDLDHNGGQQTPEMVLVLQKLKEKMQALEDEADAIDSAS
jgi:hypothetical protein